LSSFVSVRVNYKFSDQAKRLSLGYFDLDDIAGVDIRGFIGNFDGFIVAAFAKKESRVLPFLFSIFDESTRTSTISPTNFLQWAKAVF